MATKRTTENKPVDKVKLDKDANDGFSEVATGPLAGIERHRARTADGTLPTATDPAVTQPEGYVLVARTDKEIPAKESGQPAADPQDREKGYVAVPEEEQRHLVDAKSVPELEALGYRVVADDADADTDPSEDDPAAPSD